MDTEPIIQTSIAESRINGHIIKLNRPNEGLIAVDAMLEVWPRESGIVVMPVAPYDIHSLGSRPLRVTEYGALTQEEFDHYFPSTV